MTRSSVLGVLSLIFWSLIVIITIKYVTSCYGRTTTVRAGSSL